jgi:hypothetical protein
VVQAPHIDLSGLGDAVYGLAELHRKAIAQATLVATPGCYPAGAISRQRRCSGRGSRGSKASSSTASLA